MAKLERRSVLPQGLLLAQRHPCGDAASSGQEHPYEDARGCQDQPPRHHARYARYTPVILQPQWGRAVIPVFPSHVSSSLPPFLRAPQMS